MPMTVLHFFMEHILYYGTNVEWFIDFYFFCYNLFDFVCLKIFKKIKRTTILGFFFLIQKNSQ